MVDEATVKPTTLRNSFKRSRAAEVHNLSEKVVLCIEIIYADGLSIHLFTLLILMSFLYLDRGEEVG